MQLDMKKARAMLTDKVSDGFAYPTDYLKSELEILSYQSPDALDVMATEVINSELMKRNAS